MGWSFIIFSLAAVGFFVFMAKSADDSNPTGPQANAMVALAFAVVAAISFIVTLVLFIIEALS